MNLINLLKSTLLIMRDYKKLNLIGKSDDTLQNGEVSIEKNEFKEAADHFEGALKGKNSDETTFFLFYSMKYAIFIRIRKNNT